MKYELMVRSRMNPEQSIQAKHAEFMARLAEARSRWGVINTAVPTPDTGPHLLALVPLRGFLQKGIHGSLNYQYRHAAADEAINDDFFELRFNPHKLGFSNLVPEGFDLFVEAFGAYLAFIKDERFTDLDFDESRKVNKRDGVYRVYPVSFYDKELCLCAFARTPEEIVGCLNQEVEEVKLINGGVRITISSSILPLEQADQLTRKITRLLKDQSR